MKKERKTQTGDCKIFLVVRFSSRRRILKISNAHTPHKIYILF